MIYLLLRWVLTAAAFLIASKVVPGMTVKGWGSALVAALVFGALNLLVKPLLIFLTLPLTILTLGLFLLVVNAILVGLAAYFVPGVKVKGFWSAFFAAIVISLCSILINTLLDRDGPTLNAPQEQQGQTL